MPKPLLNVDGGELEDEPEELYALADVIHVACGGHAGDARSMARVVAACMRSATRIGAHPSYEDRPGFGRRAQSVAPEALAASVARQCAELVAVAREHGAEVVSVKPHGALYHAAHVEEATARACIEGIVRGAGAVIVVGPAGGAFERAAHAAGVTYAREAFADRGVRADGSLVPRGEPGALVTDPDAAAARARELAARDDVDTLCIHGDTPGALAVARAVRAALGPKA